MLLTSSFEQASSDRCVPACGTVVIVYADEFISSQSQPGIFHLLPLAQRVQTKLEQLIDHHMGQLSE